MTIRTTGLWLVCTLLTACSSVNDTAETSSIQPKPAQERASTTSAESPEMADLMLNQAGSQSSPQTLTIAPVPAPDDSQVVEPNRENYEAAEIQPIRTVAESPVSTFSIDVDTAGYANMRRFLSEGVRPPKDSIRVEELINYFDYHYAGPSGTEHPFAIHTQVAPTPWNEQTRLMRIAVQGTDVDADELPPMNLVFLLDVSGSMNQPNKLPLLQRAFSLLVDRLRPEDRVAIVVYAGASGVALEPTGGDDRARIQQALDQLQAGGSTHGSAGIQLAYQTARQHFREDGINRVILGTDGDFNVGVTDLNDLRDLIETERESGVFFSALGFGTGNYNDQLMEDLTNRGNGTAYYIDRFSEARKVFAEDLTGTLHTIAKDVKIQVEFNPARVAEYRLIGYDNRQLNREDFNNDRVDAGDVGAGHSVTALYEIVPAEGEFRFNDPLRYQTPASEPDASDAELAFVKLRYKLPDEADSTLMSLPVHSDTADTDMPESLRLATAVAGMGEILRDSPYVDTRVWSLTDARRLAETALGDDAFGYRHELVQLMRNAEALYPTRIDD